MAKREWTELDEQMANEGNAIRHSFHSTGRIRRQRVHKDDLKPGRAHVPMKGTGAGEKPMSLGQICWATNYAS